MTQIDDVRNTLTKMDREFTKVLPPGITAERFIRVVMTAVQGNPKLLEATRSTLFEACTKCATDGLIPDGREAALVVYSTKSGKKVQYLPMVRGVIKKVRNSGEVDNLNAHVVYANDFFSHWRNQTGEYLEHKPCYDGDRGEMRLVYCIARLKGVDEPEIEVMTADQVRAVQRISKANDGPWSGDFESEMWRKSVIHRISKRLPMDAQVEQVIRRDEEMYELNPPAAALPEAEPKKISGRLQKLVAKRAPGKLPEVVHPEPGDLTPADIQENQAADGADADGKFPFEKETQ